MPDLPTTLMGLLNFEGGMEAAKSTIQGRPADFILQDVELLPVIPDTPVIWCAGVNYKDHANETGRGHQDEAQHLRQVLPPCPWNRRRTG